MCKEVNVNKNKFLRATAEPYSFAYIDKINKTILTKIFKWGISSPITPCSQARPIKNSLS